MNVVVCVKRVPLTQDVDLRIDAGGKAVDNSKLSYIINEWDSYAAEEAVCIKEKTGGTVTVVTIGAKEDEDVLRKVLAMGADRAVRVDPGKQELDGAVVGKILSEIVKQNDFDLVLTGVQSDDYNLGVVGSMMAEHLSVAHAAVVNRLTVKDDKKVEISVELEGGIDEVSKFNLPAVLTIQSGINVPRYVSIMAVRKAAKKEMKVIDLSALSLSTDDLTPHTAIEEMYFPPDTGGAEMIEGGPAEIADVLIKIMKEKGAIA
jgi:electron transfer flavoprotein beta subunit